ncbi:MAG: cyclic pyranopterin monophosphate synthase MoaC [Deltaproteobacteria bacterium]|nr:cyclic pyranopterin monophosphate synthase MoaC [Deltaproteobacteria bacterium]
MKRLSHTDEAGKAVMVDVSRKAHLLRTATATGKILLAPETLRLIEENRLKKGDVLTAAEIAGIQGGKKTSELIPLCHPLAISKIAVTAEIVEDGVRIVSEARCVGQTGIEMEALTATAVALLTVYDMCKAVDKKMVITEISLLKKTKEELPKTA